MILIRLAGGLGNQIFQLGAGLLLAKKSSINKVVLDDSALENYDAQRNNELLNFFDFSKFDIECIFQNNIFAKFRFPKILPLGFGQYPFVNDKNFQKILQNPNKTLMIIDGYFQECLTQEVFDNEIELLKKIFKKDSTQVNDGCVIHIRGGDFVRLSWHSITPKEYYRTAIEKMKYYYDQKKFYIVTDDRKYSNSILKNLDIDYEFIGGSMQKDFYSIGSFQYRVLSSSTFALWASVLGDNEHSVVIAPKEWIPSHERRIYLPNEIRIEF